MGSLSFIFKQSTLSLAHFTYSSLTPLLKLLLISTLSQVAAQGVAFGGEMYMLLFRVLWAFARHILHHKIDGSKNGGLTG